MTAEVDLAANGEGIPEIVVETTYDPPWDMHRLSEEGKKTLGWE